MCVLLVAGEDIDFSNNGGVVGVTTASAGFSYRSGYGRCAVYNNGGLPQSNVFAGGALTSCWFSWRQAFGSYTTSTPYICLMKSGTNVGLLFANHNVSNGKIALYKRDAVGATTLLASEPGFSLNGSVNNRFDVQLISYGAIATVNLYINGGLVLTFTGDVTASGNTSLDCVGLFNAGSNPVSEVIVADEDTRQFPGVVTLALTGAGATDAWFGTFSNINGTSFSDANPASTNTTGQDEQFNVTDLPAVTATIKCVAQTIRAAKSATPTASKIALGYNNGGTVAVGSDISLTTAYATYNQIDAVDPTTSAAFLQSAMNALQLNARSRP